MIDSGVVTDTCLTADHFDASRRCFKAPLIHVQAAVRVEVTGRGHHDPGDPTDITALGRLASRILPSGVSASTKSSRCTT